MRTDFPDPLIVMALEVEGGDLFSLAQVPVLYTGVGKINATYHLALTLADYRRCGRPLPFVVNFGTAGSPMFDTGQLVSCSSFVQRDMDASALGFEAGSTPYDSAPAVLTFPSIVTSLPDGICGSGDSFATTHSAAQFNVVDMEAYALAKVCWLQDTRFGSIKFITDGANGAAPDAWKRNARFAAERFMDIYRHLTAQRPPTYREDAQ